jgi:hypothetical protein
VPATLVHLDSAPSIPPPYAQVVVVEAPNPVHVGETFVLDRVRMRFGRASTCMLNEINLFRDPSMSRGVGWFERRADGEWWVVDNGSTTGVSVNDCPVRRPVEGEPYRYAERVRQGDRVRVGDTVLEFRAADAAAR